MTEETAVALRGSRLPCPPAIAKEYNITAPEWRVLVEQTFPSAKSVEAVMLALAYCRKRGLDIYKRPVHIVPMWNSGLGREVETVWPGIAELRTTAVRTGAYAGIDDVEFGPEIEKTFTGEVGRDKRTISKTVKFPAWASVTVYRMVSGQRCAFRAKVFWEETYATIGKSDVPNDMWSSRPYGQLDKCVEAAAVRKAFPEEIGGMYVAEEMEGRTIDVTPAEREGPPQPPGAAPEFSQATETRKRLAATPHMRDGRPYAPKPEREPAEADVEQALPPDNREATIAELINDKIPASPDEILDDLDGQLAVCKTKDELAEVWAESLPTIGDMMPPDKKAANKLLEKHEKRIEKAKP